MKIYVLFRSIYTISLLAIVILGYSFSHTRGLITSFGVTDYVIDYPSSVADDNVLIEFSAILFFPLLICSYLRIMSLMNIVEYCFAMVIFTIQIFSLCLIEYGSIYHTIVYAKNTILFAVGY